MPHILHTPLATVTYLFVLALFVLGLYQYIQKLRGSEKKFRSLVPLGALSVVIGFIGFFYQYKTGFTAIELAGDISPQVVASILRYAFGYPILGLVGLGITLVFKYLNSGNQ